MKYNGIRFFLFFSIFINYYTIFSYAYNLDDMNLWAEIPVKQKKNNLYKNNLSKKIEKVIRKARDAVLIIDTERTLTNKQFNFSPDTDNPFDLFKFFGIPKESIPKKKAKGQGSGFIIHPSGLAVTNHHVIEGADAIKIKIGDSVKEYIAKILGSDKITDIALIQIISNKNDWPVIPLGDSEKLNVGSFALAIGNPFGLEISASFGIISAKRRRELSPSGRRGLYNFIQIDIGINPGNSGGPLLNLLGEAIGINTAISANGQNIGFAIPINQVKETIAQIKKYGHVDRSWLGVQISNIGPALAKAIGLQTLYGAYIFEVIPNSPAYHSGLKAGDVIIKINNQIIKNASSLSVIIGLASIGKKINATVLRNHKWIKVKILLKKNPHTGKIKKN